MIHHKTWSSFWRVKFTGGFWLSSGFFFFFQRLTFPHNLISFGTETTIGNFPDCLGLFSSITLLRVEIADWFSLNFLQLIRLHTRYKLTRRKWQAQSNIGSIQALTEISFLGETVASKHSKRLAYSTNTPQSNSMNKREIFPSYSNFGLESKHHLPQSLKKETSDGNQ